MSPETTGLRHTEGRRVKKRPSNRYYLAVGAVVAIDVCLAISGVGAAVLAYEAYNDSNEPLPTLIPLPSLAPNTASPFPTEIPSSTSNPSATSTETPSPTSTQTNTETPSPSPNPTLTSTLFPTGTDVATILPPIELPTNEPQIEPTSDRFPYEVIQEIGTGDDQSESIKIICYWDIPPFGGIPNDNSTVTVSEAGGTVYFHRTDLSQCPNGGKNALIWSFDLNGDGNVNGKPIP